MSESSATQSLMLNEISGEVMVPYSGEIISAKDTQALLKALDEIRYRDSIHREFKAILTRLVADKAAQLGTRTIELDDGRKAHISGGSEVQYDAEAVEIGLRAAGMPEDRIRAIVEEQVTYRVKAVEAKRAANANPLYATVIDECSREVEKPVTVSIRRS